MLEAPQEVEVIQRVKGNKKYFFVLNYMGSEQKIVLKKQMRSLYDNVIANGDVYKRQALHHCILHAKSQRRQTGRYPGRLRELRIPWTVR